MNVHNIAEKPLSYEEQRDKQERGLVEDLAYEPRECSLLVYPKGHYAGYVIEEVTSALEQIYPYVIALPSQAKASKYGHFNAPIDALQCEDGKHIILEKKEIAKFTRIFWLEVYPNPSMGLPFMELGTSHFFRSTDDLLRALKRVHGYMRPTLARAA